jgi:predicted sulfurtransferase
MLCAQGFNNIGVLHGGLLRFASKFEPAITAASG